MAAPKRPADRQEKAVKPKVTKDDTGYTIVHRGVTARIGADAFDDFELLRDLGKLQDAGKPAEVRVSLVPAVFTRLFGETESQRILDALRDPETGRVPIQPTMTFILEVFSAVNPESRP